MKKYDKIENIFIVISIVFIVGLIIFYGYRLFFYYRQEHKENNKISISYLDNNENEISYL